MTQDGRVARQLIGEDSDIDKEYLVRVSYNGITEDVRTAFPAARIKLLCHGLSLDEQLLKPAQVEWQNPEQLRFVLREGKKRQIRRMCELVGLDVVGLKRVRIGNVMLGALPRRASGVICVSAKHSASRPEASWAIHFAQCETTAACAVVPQCCPAVVPWCPWCCRTVATVVPSCCRSIILCRIELGKQHARKAELRKIRDAHRIQHADQMVAFMLDDARMETLGHAVDRPAELVEALVAQHRIPVDHAAHPRHRQAPPPTPLPCPAKPA